MTNASAAASLPERKRRNRELHGEDLAGQRTRFRSLPPMIQLEPTSRCNLSCPICARNYFDRDRNPPGDMDADVLARVTPYFDAAEDLVIGGYGEPMLAPRYMDIMETGKRAGCRVETITNGTLLFGEQADRLVLAELDRLAVSVDAASDEKMRDLRGITLQSVIDNLMGLSEIKRRHRKIVPEVEFNFTASVGNIEDLAPLVDICEQVGGRRIRVHLQKLYSASQHDRTLLLHRGKAEAEFDRAADRARAVGIEMDLPSLGAEKRECHQPMTLLFVRWNGKVMGCCSAVFENDHFNFPVGSVLEEDLAALWNCPAIVAYREAVFAGDEQALPANCRRCAFRKEDLEAQIRYLDADPDTPDKEPADG